MPPERLPSLDSLRAFEAVSRHLSFTSAAAELFVTQSAVSQRIVALEAELGVKLFLRSTRRLVLTGEGETLAAGVRRGLHEIADAMGALRRRKGMALRVTTTPSFASRWLVPRLHRFRAAVPHVAVTILADGDLVNLQGGHADVAIRFGGGRYAGLVSERLLGDAVTPVARQCLIAAGDLPVEAADLLKFQLIVDVSNETEVERAGWSHWFASLGVDLPRAAGVQGFSQSALAIGAAAGGLGVALVQTTLAGDDLINGSLVQVFPHELAMPASYYVVTTKAAAREPAVKAFHDWIKVEAAAFAAALDGLRTR
ncbi:Glycine cleavage system transcriptional activator [Alphaproteobacteria bacterium SO-S41]|nr:Glycine cleavage system transcriptional activator [Alphaproteobacteria bacterium SO-S41]